MHIAYSKSSIKAISIFKIYAYHNELNYHIHFDLDNINFKYQFTFLKIYDVHRVLLKSKYISFTYIFNNPINKTIFDGNCFQSRSMLQLLIENIALNLRSLFCYYQCKTNKKYFDISLPVFSIQRKYFYNCCTVHISEDCQFNKKNLSEKRFPMKHFQINISFKCNEYRFCSRQGIKKF